MDTKKIDKTEKTGAVVKISVDGKNQYDGAIDMQSTFIDNTVRIIRGMIGLDSLALVDQLIIKQEVEALEVISDFETANSYTVFDTSGNVVFKIEEDTTGCNRFWCGVCRSFNVMIMDTQGQPFIQLVSPNTCNCCCLRSIEVQSPPGTVIGFAQQQFNWFYPKIKIKQENKETFLTANGPFCAFGKCCTGDAEFIFTDNNGEEVGKISKNLDGAIKEMFTDSDTFSITFPKDLDSTKKAILLGTGILIDFAFFEDNN